jgi:hypothetical protein
MKLVPQVVNQDKVVRYAVILGRPQYTCFDACHLV